MTYLKKLFTLILIFACSIIAHAQESYLDSISVRIEDKMEISISIYDYETLSETVTNDMNSLQSILNENQNIPKQGNYSITYEPNKKLSIKPTGPGERVIWENGKQTRYELNNQCNILSDSYYLSIQFNEAEQLVSDNLISKLKEVLDTTNTIQKRLSKTYNYSFKDEKLIHNIELNKTTGPLDLINLKGGVGLNFIKNKPVIDLSAEAAFVFGKKGVLKNQFYLSYNQLSDFDENSKISLYSFVNIGYRYNLSKTANDPNWLGLELGYITTRQGDLFKENTFKMGVNWEIGKYISVAPQLYLSGDATEFYPALRIGFGF